MLFHTQETDLAGRLICALTHPGFEIEVPYAELPRLSDEELGTLLPEAYRVHPSAPERSMRVAHAIEHAARGRRPRYTPDACRRMFEVLVERSEERGWVDLTRGVQALEQCTGPLPDASAPVRTLVETLLAKNTMNQPHALIAVARLAGQDTLHAVVERLSQGMGPIVADEIAVAVGLAPAEQARLSETGPAAQAHPGAERSRHMAAVRREPRLHRVRPPSPGDGGRPCRRDPRPADPQQTDRGPGGGRPRADPAPADDRRPVLARRPPPRRTRRLADVPDPIHLGSANILMEPDNSYLSRRLQDDHGPHHPRAARAACLNPHE